MQILKTLFFLLFSLFIITACGSSSSNNIDITNTLYEDAENGLVDKWEVTVGSYEVLNIQEGANNSNRSIFLRHDWHEENGEMVSGVSYRLTNENGTDWNNTTQKVLHLDHMKKISKDNKLYSFTISVETDTKLGKRMLSFNTYYDKTDMNPSSQSYPDVDYIELTFPLSMQYVREFDIWQHIRLDLEEYLHQLEPQNEIISVNAFVFEGGDDYLDNISLASN